MIPTILCLVGLTFGGDTVQLIVEDVACIELNNVIRDDAPCYYVVIFWFRNAFGEWRVKAWKHLHEINSPMPIEGGKWACDWQDYNCLRRVTSDIFVITWTNYDVELADAIKGARPGLAPAE